MVAFYFINPIFVTIATLILTSSEYIALYPWTVLTVIVTDIRDFDMLKYPTTYSWLSIIVTSFISLTGCIVYFNKMDIG